MLQLQLMQSASSSFVSSMSSTPRAASPVNSPAQVARPFRFSTTQQDLEPTRRHSRLPELLTRKRTSSLPPKKEKDSQPDPFTAHPSGSTSFVTYEGAASAAPPVQPMSSSSPSSPQQSPLNALPKRARGSILLASGITLPFGRSRSSKTKKPRPAPPSTPFMYSEVIEISAPPPQPPEVDEDRERLRDAAAQSIGLDPVLLEDRESLSSRSHTRSLSQTHAHSEHSRSRSPSPSRSVSPTRSRVRTIGSRAETPAVRSLPPFPTTQSALSPWVQRSSKVAKHYQPTSLLLYALAKQWKTRVIVLTSSPSSLSGTPTHTTSFTSQSPYSTHSSASLPQNVAHLHVFKSEGASERELERVEIGADSVAFVLEEEIGGRRGAVRVGGVGGAEMTLYISDQTEAQIWIAAIKHAVLSERSVRAGLGAMTQSNGVEPRGDLDVMLSMRAQGIFAPIPPPPVAAITPTVAASHGPTASVAATSSPTPSLRSASPRPPSVAVSALRGFFGSNRPRSPSGATLDNSFASISERSGADTPPPPEDSSFGRAGTSLLGMLRSNSVSSERPLSPTTPISSVPNTPRIGNTAPADLPVQMGLIAPHVPPASLDQKILEDRERESLLPSIARDRTIGLGLTGMNGSLNGHGPRLHSNGVSLLGAPSLQPPPRRRAWTASGTPPTTRINGNGNGFAYAHTNASTAETLGVRHNGSAFLSPHATSPGNSAATSPSPVSPSTTSSPKFSPSPSLSPSLSANGAGSSSPQQQEGRPRSSWSSVSSLGSNEQPLRPSFDMSSKRWSRQGILPKRLTPPSGPPPATPPSAPAPLPTSSPSSRSSPKQQRHPYAVDTSPSRSPSQRSTHSPPSIMLGLQTFSKRASGSSVRSDSTVSTTQSRATAGSNFIGNALLQPQQTSPQTRPRSSHRVSVPPPQRPIPTLALPPTPKPGIDEFGIIDVTPLPTPKPMPTLKSSGYPSRPPHSAPATKTSFRETFTLRPSRFSLSPPTQPPFSALPPRPDETSSLTRPSNHRRSSSSGNPINLPTIPASPNPLIPPVPPPDDTLLTTPTIPAAPAPMSSRPTLLIKRRLRMLSAPSPMPPPSNPLPNPPSPAPSSINPYSVPQTPIGEPITMFQNDLSYLTMNATPPQTPLSPSQPIMSPLLPPPPEQSPEMRGITSLSPPPRRGSKQISVLQMESDSDEDEAEDKQSDFRLGSPRDSPLGKPLSLSPPPAAAASLEDVCE